MNPHNRIVALDPPGTENRTWRCHYCGEIGSHDDLAGPEQKNPCSYVYPSCFSCGQTPTCAPDCVGIAKALKSNGVRVVR